MGDWINWKRQTDRNKGKRGLSFLHHLLRPFHFRTATNCAALETWIWTNHILNYLIRTVQDSGTLSSNQVTRHKTHMHADSHMHACIRMHMHMHEQADKPVQFVYGYIIVDPTRWHFRLLNNMQSWRKKIIFTKKRLIVILSRIPSRLDCHPILYKSSCILLLIMHLIFY